MSYFLLLTIIFNYCRIDHIGLFELKR